MPFKVFTVKFDRIVHFDDLPEKQTYHRIILISLYRYFVYNVVFHSSSRAMNRPVSDYHIYKNMMFAIYIHILSLD